MERIIKRGDIYYAELNPVIGSEQGGKRPVLIISNDIGNEHSPTVIIAAITSKQTKSKLPTHFYLSDVEGLPADSIILLEQIRTIDKRRLKERVAKLNEPYMEGLMMFEDKINGLHHEAPLQLQHEKRTYTVDEIQGILGISKSSAYALVKEGQFKCINVGRHIRISKKSFDDWLDNQA